MAEDYHLRPARSILTALQRFHLRRRDDARTQLAVCAGEIRSPLRVEGGRTLTELRSSRKSGKHAYHGSVGGVPIPRVAPSRRFKAA